MSKKEFRIGCGTTVFGGIAATVVLYNVLTRINKTGQSKADTIFASVLIGGMIGVTIFIFNIIAWSIKGWKDGRRMARQAKEQRRQDEERGISRYNDLVHIGGLYVPANCKCTAVLTPAGLTVRCSGNEFFLRLDKIKDVDYQLDIDEKQYLARGTAVYDRNGDMRYTPDIRTEKKVKCYALISYVGAQGSDSMLILKDAYYDMGVCSRLVNTLKSMIHVRINRVEL